MPPENLQSFWILHDHLLNEFALQSQNTRHENKGRPNSRYQLQLTLAFLHVVSSDVSGETGAAGGSQIHKISTRSLQRYSLVLKVDKAVYHILYNRGSLNLDFDISFQNSA